MKGQISLEYLLVFSVSVSVLLLFLPVVSKIEDASKDVLLKSKLDSISSYISNSCERLLVLGKSNVSVAKAPFSMKIKVKEDEVIVSKGNISSRSSWRHGCRLNRKKFGSGDMIMVLRGLI